MQGMKLQISLWMVQKMRKELWWTQEDTEVDIQKCPSRQVRKEFCCLFKDIGFSPKRIINIHFWLQPRWDRSVRYGSNHRGRIKHLADRFLCCWPRFKMSCCLNTWLMLDPGWLMERDSAGFHESASKLKSKREILDVHFDLVLSCLVLFLSLWWMGSL